MSSLACKCVFYRSEHNAKGGSYELNFDGLKMQKWNIPMNRAQRISELISIKNKSHISILNSSGPSIDPWGTPHKISNSLLNEEPTLTFCDLSHR